MSKKRQFSEVVKKAGAIVAYQLFDVVQAGGAQGLAAALTIIASMASAVIDMAEDRAAAWKYLRDRVDLAERNGEEVSAALDSGELVIGADGKIVSKEKA